MSNRELKFRAYNTTHKKMVDLAKFTAMAFNELDIEATKGDGVYLPFSDDVILMQFIGLHDNTKWKDLSKQEQTDWTKAGNKPSQWKGKDIYEGDVVQFDNTEIGGEKYLGEVVWNDDQTLGNLSWGLWTVKGYLHTDFLGYLEIIGNVHENSELLKGKP